MITQEELKKLMVYEPDTGNFIRIVGGHGRSIGNIIGTKGSEGYIQMSINKKCYRAHRLAFLYMTGSFPKGCADHINGIRDDNRWSNLRDVSYIENKLNSRGKINSKLGIKGVEKSRNKYRARAKFNNKYYNLGTYPTVEEASKVYNNFIKKHHKEFCHST